MIELRSLSKHYGSRVAVDDITFTVQPGAVTGFLGPNGSGKSSTMRVILGLDRPTSGTALVNGRRYVDFVDPLAQVGALLDAKSAHPSRTAFDHLLAVAATHGITRGRVHDVIDIAGLDSVANARVGGFSLGMTQRLGVAVALLGDPRVLILDEPVNGLDPEGVLWIRQLLRDYANDGRTVFLSSHLMSEMALVADRIIVLGKGRVLADGTLDELTAARVPTVRVASDSHSELRAIIETAGGKAMPAGHGVLTVEGLSTRAVGDLAARSSIALHELVEERSTLEEAYLELTEDAVEYRPQGAPRPQ